MASRDHLGDTDRQTIAVVVIDVIVLRVTIVSVIVIAYFMAVELCPHASSPS